MQLHIFTSKYVSRSGVEHVCLTESEAKAYKGDYDNYEVVELDTAQVREIVLGGVINEVSRY